MTGALPKLPGYTIGDAWLDRASFGRPQTLRVIKNGQADEGVQATIIDDTRSAPLPSADTTLKMTTARLTVPQALTPNGNLPKWVAWDRKVLRFYGYFKESVTESRVENYRVRKLVLLYYLEDDSVHVSEPRQDNSGLDQGVFVKRHKLLKSDNKTFFTPLDFAVGGEVDIYGRILLLTDCDAFTRSFYAENGMEQASCLPTPEEPFTAHRAAMSRTGRVGMAASTQPIKARDDPLKKFLHNNRKVLRFFCIWDDREAGGDYRPYVLNFYLEDDTVEVLEVIEPNGGRDPFPKLLARCPLPRRLPKLDISTPRVARDQCYGPEDFRIGQVIDVYNRPFLIYDADPFTKSYLATKFHYSDEDLAALAVEDTLPALPPRIIPAWNGYGSLEDSMGNVMNLIPKPPKRDFIKLMKKEKMAMRFYCRMVNGSVNAPSPADTKRVFVMSYYLATDELSIFEPPVRNSGVVGGKFLERQVVFHAGTQRAITDLDLYVGAVLNIFHRDFELYEADEFTMRYMEENCANYPQSNLDRVLGKISGGVSAEKVSALKSALLAADKEGMGRVTVVAMREALQSALGVKIHAQEALTLFRHLDASSSGYVPIAGLLNTIL